MATETREYALTSEWQQIAEANGRASVAMISAPAGAEVVIADGEAPRPSVTGGHNVAGEFLRPLIGAEIIWARGAGLRITITQLAPLPGVGGGASRSSSDAVARASAGAALALAQQAYDKPGIPGDDAYEVAVESGFQGTRLQWLESLKGERGLRGLRGEDGVDGVGVSIRGELASSEDLPATAEPGDSYLINGELWVWSDTWVNVGVIRGPKGDAGDKGDPGDDGRGIVSEEYDAATGIITLRFGDGTSLEVGGGGTHIEQFTIVTQQDVRAYSTNSNGDPLGLTQTNHMMFGIAPYGPLVMGEDYTIVDGGLLLNFDPAANELLVVMRMPRMSNTQAQVLLQEHEDRVRADADRAEAAANRLEDLIFTPKKFGAVCDGVADDTAAIRALHVYSNLTNIAPDYSGVKTFAVQADAQIPVNTDVDFRGASIRVLNGMDVIDGWHPNRNVLFAIEDPNRPLVGGDINVVGANFAQGRYDACTGLIPGAGYVHIQLKEGTNLPRIASRDGLTMRGWRIAQKVFANGKTQWPLPVDGSGVTLVYRAYRLNSDNSISVGNATFFQSDYTNQRLFQVQRNGVRIHDLDLLTNGPLPARAINDTIQPSDCSDFTVERVRGVNPNNDQSIGTYVLNMQSVANVLVRDCHVRGGNWAWQSSNFCNGIRFENCDVPRLDGHDYTANFFVSDCTLHERGIAIGQGGGQLSVRGVTFHQTRNDFPLLHGRPDYGNGAWDGDITVDGYTIVARGFGGANGNIVVDFGTYPIGNVEGVLSAPHTITARNGTLITYDAQSTATRLVTPVYLKVSPTAAGVIAPRSILVDTLVCASRVNFANELDLISCQAPLLGSNDGCHVTIRNLISTAYYAARYTLNLPAHNGAPRSSFRIDTLIEGCTKSTLLMTAVTFNTSKLRVRGASLGRAQLSASLNIRYEDVDFDDPNLIGAETSAPICPVGSGSRYCSIVGGRLAGAYDFAKIVASVGLITDTFTIGSAILPGTATREQMFTGWIAP